MGKKSKPFTKVQPYNYKRPDRISKNQLRSLHFVHDRFSRNVSSAISAFLRKVVEINLDTIEQIAYAEYLAAASDPTCYSSVSLKPLEGSAALEVSPSAVYSILDRLLGGSGAPLEIDRPMTEIEQNVLQRVLKIIVDHLKEAWRQIYAIEFAVTATETHPHMIQVVSPNEMVVVFTFQMRTRDCNAKITLAFPTLALEPIMHIFDKEWTGRKKTAAGSTLASNIHKVPVNVSIETGQTYYPLRSILTLEEGDTLVLEQRKELPMVLRVSGKEKLKAHAKLEASRKRFEVVESLVSAED
jgi:flagellar motor switch protein FliM